MRLITKQALIATAAERFRDAYQRQGAWIPSADGFDPATVFAALSALPSGAAEAAVIAASGDDRWTANLCDECGEDVPVTVLMAEEIHHPTDAVTLCPTCLAAALALVDLQAA